MDLSWLVSLYGSLIRPFLPSIFAEIRQIKKSHLKYFHLFTIQMVHASGALFQYIYLVYIICISLQFIYAVLVAINSGANIENMKKRTYIFRMQKINLTGAALISAQRKHKHQNALQFLHFKCACYIA